MFTNFKAKKSLGQNFLINLGVLDKIISAAEIKPSDIVLEIGPGKGALTKLLADKAKKVITIEKDSRLINPLKESLEDFSNIEILENDILKFNPAHCSLLTGHYKIVANIPYYITSHLLRTIFEKWPRPELIVLTVQKEVAKRITAKPPDMNLLALSVQLYSKPEIIGYISKGSFRPIPKVDSAIIKLTPKPNVNIESVKKVLDLAKKAFAGKRKQIQNTLKNEVPNIETILGEIGLEPSIRPEKLSIENWIKICSYLS